jgi:hypothetical protein
MAHYAFLDDTNTVVEVITGIDETELIEGKTPEVWYAEFKGLKCVRTSYNGNIRKQYAGIGFYYDPVSDVFITPQPYPSWSLDSNFDWKAPKEKPEGFYYWDEDLGEWVEHETVA